jgi:hypothetical protein
MRRKARRIKTQLLGNPTRTRRRLVRSMLSLSMAYVNGVQMWSCGAKSIESTNLWRLWRNGK